jgi:hypothetical protein
MDCNALNEPSCQSSRLVCKVGCVVFAAANRSDSYSLPHKSELAYVRLRTASWQAGFIALRCIIDLEVPDFEDYVF